MNSLISVGTVVLPACEWADPKLTVTQVADDFVEGTALPRSIELRVDESPIIGLRQGASVNLPGRRGRGDALEFRNSEFAVVKEGDEWKCYSE